PSFSRSASSTTITILPVCTSAITDSMELNLCAMSDAQRSPTPRNCQPQKPRVTLSPSCRAEVRRRRAEGERIGRGVRFLHNSHNSHNSHHTALGDEIAPLIKGLHHRILANGYSAIGYSLT